MAYIVDFSEACRLLHEERVVAIPTETVYGLAGSINSPIAIHEIFSIKKRPQTNPLIVHCSSADKARDCVYFSNPTQEQLFHKLSRAFWPGPLTIVLPKNNNIADEITAGQSSVALRVPGHPLALELLRNVGQPLAAPSANTSNYLSPTSVQHVLNDFIDVDLPVLAGENCHIGLESTVISLLSDIPLILRKGFITKEHLSSVLGVVEDRCNEAVVGSALSPGLLKKHYSPKTPFHILTEDKITSEIDKADHVFVTFFSQKLDLQNAAHKILSDTHSIEQVAQNFYSLLHDIDDGRYKKIFFLQTEQDGLAAAILERAYKAAADN